MTPFDGVGLWVFPAFFGGTDLTPAEAQAYAAQGVQWVAIKCSDWANGPMGNPDYPAQAKIVADAGMRYLPWAFIESGGNEALQIETAWKAAGSPPSGAPMICDIESAVNVGIVGRTLASYGLVWACTTWADPQVHPGAPSVGQLADIGCSAFMPQSYYSAMSISPAGAIQMAVTDYGSLGLGSFARPLLPLVDGPALLTAAQACKAAGLTGISAWRYGSNGITPAAFQGVGQVFGTAPSLPTYSLAAPTVVSQLSSPTDPWDACGEACVASVVTDAGLPQTPGEVVTWALANNDAASNGVTTAQNLVATLAHFGIQAAEVQEPLAQSIPTALSRSHEIVVLVTSDSDGNPTTPGVAGHWLLIWGESSGGYKAMNPLSNPAGQLDTYPVAVLQACDQRDAVEILYVEPKDGGQPLTPPSVPTLSTGTDYALPDGGHVTFS